MCGIAGLVGKRDTIDLSGLLVSMTELIVHRGPDGEGYFIDHNVGLGHRRLSILDLSPRGAQPMESRSGRYVISYNGEIYNYIEIRAELEQLNWCFRSDTDTEVILTAYEQWGEQCVHRFNGMWAFAIYDRDQRILFCSRDRFGVKPFYFVDNSDLFAFGSEIKQLLPLMAERRANVAMLKDFLLTSITEHTEATFFVGIKKLLPAHNLIYVVETGECRIYRYYQIGRQAIDKNETEDEIKRQYKDILESSIALRLRSDVRVGTCLSGGLDSSTIATLAATMYAQSSVEPFSAITAVSSQHSNDESGYASEIVKNSSLRWFQVRPTYQDFVGSLSDVTYYQEEPYGSPSIIMQYFVMKTAKESHVTVLLDGQGGDETLLGYEKYYVAHIIEQFRHHGIWGVVRGIVQAGRNNAKMRPRKMAMYLVAGSKASLRYAYYRFRHRYLRNAPRIPEHLVAYSKANLDIYELQVLENTRTNLPVLLRYEDKNSMACSIETRLPFLDYRLVEYALSMPGRMKIREGWTKWVLRSMMEGQMPDSIVWRKNKYGFEAPENEWLKHHETEMNRMILGSCILGQLCSMKKLNKMLGRMDLRSRWRLYSISLWEERYKVTI